jgi:hypothetical protein
VEAAAVFRSPQLDDAQPPALRAVEGRELLKRDHAVGDALQLHVRALGGAVLQQQDRALSTDEELLEGQDLPAVAERVLGRQAHLGERVENHAGGVSPGHGVEHALGGLGQLYLGGVIHG